MMESVRKLCPSFYPKVLWLKWVKKIIGKGKYYLPGTFFFLFLLPLSTQKFKTSWKSSRDLLMENLYLRLNGKGRPGDGLSGEEVL